MTSVRIRLVAAFLALGAGAAAAVEVALLARSILG
jgi:hypothetical protein